VTVGDASRAGPLHRPSDGSPPRFGEEPHSAAGRTPPRYGEGDQAKPGGGGPPILHAPIKTVKRARKLRREMSPPERLLWWALKQHPGGFRFRKQCPQGPFSLDFACLSARLAVEVDGAAHDAVEQQARDVRRDRYLAELGFETMRIPAAEVLGNLDGVVSGIVATCRRRGPLHRPLDGPPPRSGEEQE
jgi:very-short-patch-repair endonuclease